MHYYLNETDLIAILSNPIIPRLDKLLTILFWDSESPKSVGLIKTIGAKFGLRECGKWNVSDILLRGKGLSALVNGKWSLTLAGKAHLAKTKLIGKKRSQKLKDVADLRALLTKIPDSDVQSFIEEAIACLESNQNRASIVYAWIGAVAVLYNHVVKHHLAAFNAEALRRNSKWKNAKNADDLARMKEVEFLDILDAISLIGKNLKQELQQCLQSRNSCGHPNSLKIGERKVAAHIEILILNVFAKF